MPVDEAGANGFTPVDVAVDRESPTPLYHQIYAGIEEQVRDGRLRPGERIQQERELAAALGISLAPVRQAILALVRDGYLERSRGRGTFVRERAVEEQISILSSFSSLLEATGRPWSLDLLHLGVVAADEPVAKALGGVGRAVHVQRLAVLDGEPVALLNAYLDGVRFAALAQERLHGSLYARLARDFGVSLTSARNEIGLATLTRDEAHVLRRKTKAAVLEVVSVTNDQHGTPTEYSRVLYDPERFRFRIDSHRHDESVVRLLAPSHP